MHISGLWKPFHILRPSQKVRQSEIKSRTSLLGGPSSQPLHQHATPALIPLFNTQIKQQRDMMNTWRLIVFRRAVITQRSREGFWNENPQFNDASHGCSLDNILYFWGFFSIIFLHWIVKTVCEVSLFRNPWPFSLRKRYLWLQWSPPARRPGERAWRVVSTSVVTTFTCASVCSVSRTSQPLSFCFGLSGGCQLDVPGFMAVHV